MKIYEESEGDPINPHLVSFPLGLAFSISPDKQEIIVGLMDDPNQRPHVGFRMKTELFLKSINHVIKLLARLGYKVWDNYI